MNVIRGSIIVTRMPTVVILKDLTRAIVQNPTLVMARSVKVAILIYSIILVMTMYSFFGSWISSYNSS